MQRGQCDVTFADLFEFLVVFHGCRRLEAGMKREVESKKKSGMVKVGVEMSRAVGSGGRFQVEG
jgi:hypothetical protein